MTKKILIVDDEPDIIKLISDILSEHSFNIITSSTVEESLRLIKDNEIDIALLDVSLDEKKRDGVFLLKVLKEKNNETPVIMMSVKNILSCRRYPFFKYRLSPYL